MEKKKIFLSHLSLIGKLSKNDFRKRYAGSYLGVIWAMVPPIVTVLMYWFVFDKIFGASRQMAANGIEVPYVLFLTAGLVPWFFFSDAFSGGAAALLEYSYLVKKVVFKIEVLPVVKVTAALFTHAFFTFVLIVIAAIYGYYPRLHYLELIYYTLCEYVLAICLSYITSAVVVYFRDLQQIINIILQVGIWATPILWNINSFTGAFVHIAKLNPMAYIVEGYRNAIYGDKWFWEHPYFTAVFWVSMLALFILSQYIFKKLKREFADLL